MNLDVSVAPEIAQLIAPGPRAVDEPPAPGAAVPADADAHETAGDGARATVGRLARELRLITAAPERWWGLVRFDPEHTVRVGIPAGPSCEAWLLIIPPAPPGGAPSDWTGHGAGHGAECGCEVVTVVAGEVIEQAIGDRGLATTPLLPGKVRVHGRGQVHHVMNRSNGYAVSLHARASQR